MASLFWTCTENKQRSEPPQGDPRPANFGLEAFAYKPYQENPFEKAPDDSAAMKEQMTAAFAGNPLSEDLLALAHCNCSQDAKAKQLQTQATTQGVMPQIIVPPIRALIAGNETLSTLAKLPFGLGDLLGGLFATDEQIADQIRGGLQEKIAASTPGGSNLAERVPFRFDAFLNKSNDTTFAVKSQIPRWYLTFATPGLWDNGTPVDGEDHGLQVLELLRVMMEWNYLMGLEKDAEGKPFGGLTRDVTEGLQGGIGPFDPRENPTAQHYFSGEFEITIPEADSDINIATQSAEEWQADIDSLPLIEQASLWLTAAKAFSRLRTDRRGAFAGLFGEKGKALLPDDTHNLPLAFLPSLDALLNGPFIDRDIRTIFRTAQFGESKDKDNRASLAAMGRLISAITHWTKALNDIEKAGVFKPQEEKLKEAPVTMKPAAQLAILTILGGYTTTQSPTGIGLKTGSGQLGQAAEAIYHLIEAERTYHSPFLKSRVQGLCHWFAAGPLKALWAGDSQDYAAADLIWAYNLLDAMESYLPEEPSWHADAKEHLWEMLP